MQRINAGQLYNVAITDSMINYVNRKSSKQNNWDVKVYNESINCGNINCDVKRTELQI